MDSNKCLPLDNMPLQLKEAYPWLANPDPGGLQIMFERDVARMVHFKDISDADIKDIKAPALVINGDAEVVLAQHALTLSRILPNGQLAILPGGHGDYIGEICAPDRSSKLPFLVLDMIENFLKE